MREWLRKWRSQWILSVQGELYWENTDHLRWSGTWLTGRVSADGPWRWQVSYHQPLTMWLITCWREKRRAWGHQSHCLLARQNWMGKVSGVQKEEWMDSDPMVGLIVKDLLKKLESNAPPRKRAPRMLSVFLPSLEALVIDKNQDPAVRTGAWTKLVKIWGSLRFDDIAHLRHDTLKSYDGKLSGLLKGLKQRALASESRSCRSTYPKMRGSYILVGWEMAW